MDLPDDWHTGLDIVQSILNVSYVGSLDQFQTILGWQKNKQGHELLLFPRHSVNDFRFWWARTFVLHTSLSARALQHQQRWWWRIATTLLWWPFLSPNTLDKLKESNNKWMATCGVKLTHNFLSFVEAYPIGNAVCIEYGYQKHAPMWSILDQNKYMEAFFTQ